MWVKLLLSGVFTWVIAYGVLYLISLLTEPTPYTGIAAFAYYFAAGVTYGRWDVLHGKDN